MPLFVKSRNQDNEEFNSKLQTLPDKCPSCKTHGQPTYVYSSALKPESNVPLLAVFRCPVISCRTLFIAQYKHTGGSNQFGHEYSLVKTSLERHIESHEFPKNIEALSTLFCLTYNQARTAEANGLDQICGPGYRKSLEFLVKDYLTLRVFKDDTDKQEEVKKSFLGNAIELYIDQDRIKQCAKRATWIGNDETHYTRKWEDKDISDLRSLILMTVNYIDLTIESDRYLNEMP